MSAGRLLLVDDEPQMLRILKPALTAAGYDVSTAVDGQSALARMASKLPQLVALRESVAAVPAVAAYLASPRRIPFNEHGIFRHYPELDP